MNPAAEKYNCISVVENQLRQPSRRASCEYRFARDIGACEGLQETMKPGEYWGRDRKHQCGRDDFQKGTACSEQRGPRVPLASRHENTRSAPDGRNWCVPEL